MTPLECPALPCPSGSFVSCPPPPPPPPAAVRVHRGLRVHLPERADPAPAGGGGAQDQGPGWVLGLGLGLGLVVRWWLLWIVRGCWPAGEHRAAFVSGRAGRAASDAGRRRCRRAGRQAGCAAPPWLTARMAPPPLSLCTLSPLHPLHLQPRGAGERHRARRRAVQPGALWRALP